MNDDPLAHPVLLRTLRCELRPIGAEEDFIGVVDAFRRLGLQDDQCIVVGGFDIGFLPSVILTKYEDVSELFKMEAFAGRAWSLYPHMATLLKSTISANLSQPRSRSSGMRISFFERQLGVTSRIQKSKQTSKFEAIN